MIELEYVEADARPAIALTTLQCPPANAFTLDGLLQRQQAIKRLHAQPSAREIAGNTDLNNFTEGNKELARVVAARFGAAFETLRNARPVVIAAINGYAMGGGLECALACDTTHCGSARASRPARNRSRPPARRVRNADPTVAGWRGEGQAHDPDRRALRRADGLARRARGAGSGTRSRAGGSARYGQEGHGPEPARRDI
jgi:hypothetical protein